MTAPTPIPTDAELIERARALGPLLVRNQAETERLTRYSEEVHQAFRAAGFYRMLMPKRYGGYECRLQTYFQILREIARHCPSTGWMFGLTINHTITVASFFSEHAQDAIFAGGEFLAPLTAKPEGTAVLQPDGGWRISGTFHYNTGAPYSTHMMSHVVPDRMPDGSPPAPMLFIAPRDSYTILDDWGDVMGLKGSGSNSIRFDDAYIPPHFAMPGRSFITLDPNHSVGRDLHDNPMYGGSTSSFYLIDGANVAVGMAKGALDEYERFMTTRQIPAPPFFLRIDDADYRRWYGTVVGQLATAEAALDGAADRWMALSDAASWRRQDDLLITGMCREAIYTLATNAMLTIIRTAGSSNLRNGQRTERVWRDFTQLYSHGMFFLYDNGARDLATERLGPNAARSGWMPELSEALAAE